MAGGPTGGGRERRRPDGGGSGRAARRRRRTVAVPMAEAPESEMAVEGGVAAAERLLRRNGG